MPAASITSTILGVPVVGASRNDAVAGSVVTLQSTNVHTTYSWTFAYKPPGSTAAFSGSATAASPGTFTVDLEGPYLIRLTADLGLGTETTQYVRIRFRTVLGALDLVSAGEGYGGAIPVPVDQTPTGWTDALNTNLMTLLGLVGRISTSSHVFSVDPTEGYGDYTTIQAAIDAAVTAGAAPATPYVIQVRPGLYTENVTFASGVYVMGYPGSPADMIGFPVVLVRGTHTVPMTNLGDTTLLVNLTLENITSSTDATVLKTGTGSLSLFQCVISQTGTNAAQGPALRVDAGTVVVYECLISTDSAFADRAAVTQPSTSSLSIYRSIVRGPTGLVLNSSSAASVVTQIFDTAVTGTDAAGTGILSDAGSLVLQSSTVASSNAAAVTIHPSGGAFATSQTIEITFSKISTLIRFDITGIVGATSLSVGSSEYTGISLPGGNPTTLAAMTMGTSLFYDNATSGLTAENVQEAIDELDALVDAVRTLDDAYDGGVPNSGSGRIIVADQGSVRISDAPVASDPPEAGATNGRLEVVSSVRVGAIDAPEINVDPNPYGSGAAIVMGNRVVPNNNPWSAGTTMVMANSTGSPLFRNYDLRVQTKSSLGGGAIGRLILQGGDGLSNGGITPDASSVFLQAGSAFDATAVPGNVYISYGSRTGGASGSIILVRPEGSTAATLTAAGACADPIGVDGSITFATNMGAVTLTVAATDTRATVISNLTALDGISAADSGGGVIRITTDHLGANAEVYFLTATAGVDAAIGGFDGQVQVDGTYGEYIDAQVSADQEVSFGVTGIAGPLVYNADTGKLTVPGIIDPTAVIFEEAAAPTTGATEGAIFVSDGSGGLVVGNLYYQGPSSAAPIDLTASSSASSLSAVLAVGNTTGGTDIVISGGDALDASVGALLLPLAAVPAQTANGSVVWDSNDFLLTIGDGSSRKTMVDTTTVQTISDKTLLSPTITRDDASTNTILDVMQVSRTTSGVAAASIGTAVLYQVENAAGTTVEAARIATYLTDAGAGTEDSSLAFSTRTAGGAVTPRWDISGVGHFIPVVDNTSTIGDAANRVAIVSSVVFATYNASGDTNPIYQMDNTGFAGGPGGASALDVSLTRINAGGALWNMDVGLRVGGDVTRNEGAITFGTTRTNNGGGDDVTVQPSAAVAAAGSAQPGGILTLNASSAAALGPGNFAAQGGFVNITAGNSAAVNTAQINGPNVVIQGGDAASGGGGGAASGGGVSLQGAAGVAGGDGGSIDIKPGQLDGGGSDGQVIFSINGASRTPDLVPRATNEGNVGNATARWAAVAFLDENSSGQKRVGFATKVFGDSPYTVQATDYIVLYDPSGGNSTVNLPAVASNTNRVLVIKHSSSSGNTVTVDGDGAETIDGNLTIVLTSFQSISIICDGTAWFIL